MRSPTLTLLLLVAASAACSSARPTPAAPAADATVAHGAGCIGPYYKLRRSPATADAIARTLVAINVADDKLIQVLRVEESGAAPAVLFVVARCFRQHRDRLLESGSDVYIEDTRADASGTTPDGFEPEAIAR